MSAVALEPDAAVESPFFLNELGGLNDPVSKTSPVSKAELVRWIDPHFERLLAMRSSLSHTTSENYRGDQTDGGTVVTRVIDYVSVHREDVSLLIIVTVYSVILSVLTIARMDVLQSSAWDLGNYNQAMFTFTHNGMLFYWTADIPQNPGGSLFGGHFSPFLALLAPAYFLLSRPETLLVIQSIAIGCSTIPVWLFAKNVIRIESSKVRVTLPMIYLLQPAILGLNWFDFHPEAFIPLFYLLAAYFLIQHRFVPGILSATLLLSTIEYAPLLLLSLSIVLGIQELRKMIEPRNAWTRAKHTLPWIAIACFSLAWLYLAISVIRIFNPHDPTTSGVTSNWTVLGADNVLQVPLRALANPAQAADALLTDGGAKLGFLVVLGLPFALFPLLSPRFWFLSSPWLIPALLSNTPGYYTIGLQYTSFVFPPLVLSFLLQLRKPLPFSRFWHRRLNAVTASPVGRLAKLTTRVDFRTLLISATLVSLALSNPIVSFSTATSQWANYGAPLQTTKSLSANELLQLVPSNASILTDYYIFPLVSSRLNAYTWPYVINYPTVPFPDYLKTLVTKSAYILVDLDTFLPYVATILGYTNNDFGVLGYSDNLLLLKEGYIGTPVIFRPFVQTYAYSQLKLLSGRVTDDPSSTTGKTLTRYGNETTSSFWDGPNVLVPPGVYSVDFRIKMNTPHNGNALSLGIQARELAVNYNITTIGKAMYQLFAFSRPAAVETLSSIDFNSTNVSTGSFEDITQIVRLDSLSFYDFSGQNTSLAGMSLDRIQVTEISPLARYSTVRMVYQNGTSLFLDASAGSTGIEQPANLQQHSSLSLDVRTPSRSENLNTATSFRGTSSLDSLLSPEAIINCSWPERFT